jgi:4'-phosphopantetheinyl transferase EntD
MLAALLPPDVSAVESFGTEAEPLLPAERVALGRVGDARRREFTAGRSCARRALRGLGRPDTPLPRGGRGEPIWPPGTTGSITHCVGYVAAAVGCREVVGSIGIDAEPDAPLPAAVAARVILPAERRWLRAAPATGVHWDRLLFAAKESVYKAWYPLTGRWLGFLDARITVAADAGRFHARLLVGAPPVGGRPLTGFDGRFGVARGLIVAAVITPPVGPPTATPGHAGPDRAGRPSHRPSRRPSRHPEVTR